MILAPSIAGIELRVLFFVSRLLKLNIKFNKPIEVIALTIAEIIALGLTLWSIFNSFSFFMITAIILLLIKIFGLWNLKKWIIYIYIFGSLMPLFTENLRGLGLLPVLFSLIGNLLVLLVYYIYVYQPNKEAFK
jgi:hypothetical protein